MTFVFPQDQPQLLMSADDLPPPFHSIRLTSHPLQWTHVPHRHEFWQLVFVRQGTGEICLNKSFRVEEGELAVLPPDQPHLWKNAAKKPLVLFNLHISAGCAGFGELEQMLASVCRKPDEPAIAPGRKRLRELLELTLSEISRGDYGYRYQSAALLTELVIVAVREISAVEPRQQALCTPSARIGKALWYLETNYAKTVTLEDLGKALNLSPKHVCHIFRKELGTSPLNQLRKLRIEKARAFLEETDLSAKEIAFATGFNDEHYFNRLFRKLVGVPPLAYRRRNREI
jgi:AraC-like DNA-binding protein